MSVFSATVEALLAGRSVYASLLYTWTFPDASVVRLWNGPKDIVIGGLTYKGAGRLVSAEGLSADIGDLVPNASFKFSGVDATIVPLLIAEKDNVPGCDITCAVQVFGDGSVSNPLWTPIGSPVVIGTWKGDQLSFERSAGLYDVSLSAISYFATGALPRQSFYSDREQKIRYASDRGAEFMAGLATLSIRWPFGVTGVP